MKMLRFLLGTAICALTGLLGAFPAAAESFPSAPVKIIVGVGPGSSPDVITRLIADQLSRLWRQQVIVLNQPGAGGAISIRAAGNAAPDGHTLFVSLASNYVLLPQTQAGLPFDVARDFVPIGFVGEHPMLIAASPALGVSTLGELGALARKRPGELNIAAGNHGSILHLTAEWLRAATGTDLTIVNYPALPQALADLIGGRIQLMVEAVSGLSGAIGAGKVKPLAVASAQRLPDRPDIPATTELLAGFIASGWFALVAPPKTPEAIARFVSADLRKVLAQPEVGERLRELGTYTRPMSPPELAGFIRDQQTIWKPVIEQVRLKSPQ